MERLSKHEYYLKIARAVAARSTCLRKRYGAVIVKDDRIIATGYNGAPRGEPNCCDVGECYCQAHDLPRSEMAATHGRQYGSCVAVHAEMNALICAPIQSLAGATLYLAGYDLRSKKEIQAMPCNVCERMLKNAGITTIITGAKNEDDNV